MVAPNFRSIPDLVNGIPVPLEIFCFAWVMPNNRFHEKEIPLIICKLIVNILKPYYSIWIP